MACLMMGVRLDRLFQQSTRFPRFFYITRHDFGQPAPNFGFVFGNPSEGTKQIAVGFQRADVRHIVFVRAEQILGNAPRLDGIARDKRLPGIRSLVIGHP